MWYNAVYKPGNRVERAQRMGKMDDKEDRSLWLILAGIVVFSLWFTLTRRTENALWLVLAAICFLILAYRAAGAWAATRAAALRDEETAGSGRLPTPAWVAFAYQFAAIAGVGVLVGPVLAAQFGYLPGYLWILLAALLVGAVHDTVVLAASSRQGGAFLPAVVRTALGPWSALAAWAVVLVALVGFLAVTGSYAATLLAGNLWAMYAVAATIVVAALASAYELWLRPGRVGEAIALGVVLAGVAIVAGAGLARQPIAGGLLASRGFVLLLLAVYVAVSAVAPLRWLGRARVAISGCLTLGAAGLLALVIAFAAPSLRQPATTGYVSGGGPLIAGSLFPYLAIIFGAGVISGLNALATTATTSRLLARDRDALPVGFGAALAQALFVLLLLVSVSTVQRWDFYALTTTGPLGEIERIAQSGQRDWDTLRGVLQADGVRVPGGPTTAASVDNSRQPAGATALAASVAWMLRGFPGVKQAWLPGVYRFMFLLQALILVAVLEAGVRAARVAAEHVGGALALVSPLAARQGAPRAAQVGVGAALLALMVLWLTLAAKVDVLRTYTLMAFVSLLLAAIGLSVGWAAVRPRAGRGALLLVAPLVAVVVLAASAGVVTVRDSVPYLNRSKSLAQVYGELPRWAPASSSLNADRARELVQQWPAAELSRTYVQQGQAEVASQLRQRLGLAENDARSIAGAIGGRATGLSLWSWLQVILTLLLSVLALAVLAGHWVRVPLVWPRPDAPRRPVPAATVPESAPVAAPKEQTVAPKTEGPDFEI